MALMLIHIIRSRLLNWFLTLCKLLQYICTWGGLGVGVLPIIANMARLCLFQSLRIAKARGFYLLNTNYMKG